MRESGRRRALRWLNYRSVSALLHHPRALRLLAALVRHQPWFGRFAKMVATRNEVVACLQRPLAFSSTVNRPNLVAGDFVIGMESGPRHDSERHLLLSKLPDPAAFARHAADASRQRIEALLAGQARRFDLLDDYMVPVAWEAISRSFGALLPALAPDDPMLMNIRYVGAHLVVGSIATESVQRRAMDSATEMNAWVRGRIDALQGDWGMVSAHEREAVARNVVGLLWVGHPATAQSGALIVQELFARRSERQLAQLGARVRAHADPWQDDALRQSLKDHVLELLRFRPPFPLLKRDVRRDTRYGPQGENPIAGGTQLTLLMLGAMFDPAAMASSPDRYEPGREFHNPRDRYLVFGWGDRQCIARDVVVEILAGALLGVLLLPQLSWADPWWRRIRYDGPMIASMRVKFRKG
jgi:cytochrome P450